MNILNDVEEIVSRIQEADKVLVGIGDDFEMTEYLHSIESYQNIAKEVAETECQWVMPYVNFTFLRDNSTIKTAYQNLARLLDGKDYFIISACMNGMLDEAALTKVRIVEPCGSYRLMQKDSKDGIKVLPTEQDFLLTIDDCMSKKSDWKHLDNSVVFNSLYAEPYCESGYQDQWKAYTNWLQGTLNKNLCILELGASMMFASVLRFRFEKIVSLNKKACLIRINKRLYHLPEQISEKGVSVSKNAVEFMAQLVGV